MPREEMKTRLESTVKKLRMENLLGRNLFRMSGGEKQKVACACADTSDAPIIVFDEPSSNLDLHSIRELADIIEQWKKDGKTVIVAEHRLYYMLPFADRLLNILQPLLANEEADDSESTKDFAALMEEIKKIYGAKFPSLEKKIKQLRYFHIVREETQYLWETLFCILRRCLKRTNKLLLGNSDYEHGIANLFYEELIKACACGTLSESDREKITRRNSKHPLAEKVWAASKLLVFDSNGETLKGISGSTGTAVGPARIIRSPSEFYKMQKGDVLVCEFTDPEWTPLFKLASAVVADTGAALSHAAIVAREFGLPAVLGTGFATSRFRDGQNIRVDGDKGEVYAV